jgi:hypothetical protein
MAVEQASTRAGPSARVAVAFIVFGLLLGASTLFKIVPAVYGSFTSQHTVAVPGSTRLHLHAAKYVLFERTDGPPTIRPDQVEVSAPNGEPVPVSTLDSVSESITRGSRTYDGAVSFRAPTAGDYVVKVTSEPREAIVARSIGDTLGAVAVWFLLAVLGGAVVVIGVVLLIIGFVRRGRATRDADQVAPWPPPDWPSTPKP